ncbi:ABC transporter transmembrane domain-containing protein [Stakelama pacifica]|uniref:Putative ABC transport system ATP-binding protein n=1 Tax=Stakelama pacifica TaxID=517720 RepID=A0A4R6FX58_9SPHN|nr:ABC transporter ATP-binding protein [Stakelama pacifica]TDN86491.1 putative ABC transport system ATP-binding protein [Stakelama pacifica]GGO89807.1 ABC transporter ATP-binding protein [Stakelama pacifica]
MATQRYGFRDAAAWLREIIGPDSAYIKLGIVYTVAISLLSLATPISVQLLINSVARTALPAPLWTLSAMLFLLLLLVAALSSFRVYVMYLFEQRLFARVVAEITVRAVHAQNPFFADENRGHLFNRYFDLTVVQKAVPSLVIGAFTILLRAAVGLAVTSFYHPFFLAFNAILVLIVFGIWALWRRGAITSAVALSHAKHEAARWLESVGASNGFYKSSRHMNFAMDRSEQVTRNYVTTHQRYFRYSFAQTLGFFLLYAVASAALLLLGGTLILRMELSLGQLVAAELILSGVFYGIYQLGWYLDTFYDLVASSEELSLVFSIPQESGVASGTAPRGGAVKLRDVEISGARLNFEMASGEQIVAVVEPGIERVLALTLKRHASPERGIVSVGGRELGEFDMYLLRTDIVVLDRPTIVEVTIREYLSLAVPSSGGDIMDVLDEVGLTERIGMLPEGLDTQLGSSGAPLSISEVMSLKLANALLRRPKVLVLSQLFDMMPTERLQRVLTLFRDTETTVLLSTVRPGAMAADGYKWIGWKEQRRFESEQALSGFLKAREARNG